MKNLIILFSLLILHSCDYSDIKLQFYNNSDKYLRIQTTGSFSNFKDTVSDVIFRPNQIKGIGLTNQKWDYFFKNNDSARVIISESEYNNQQTNHFQNKILKCITINKGMLDSINWLIQYP
jgi:hypothetical protein